MTEQIDSMTESELDLALAELIPDLRGAIYSAHHNPPLEDCEICQAIKRGWTPKEIHLEDLAEAMWKRWWSLSSIYGIGGPLLNHWAATWMNRDFTPGKDRQDTYIEAPTLMLAAKRAALKALRKEQDGKST